MKKIVSIVSLSTIMFLSSCGCSNNNPETKTCKLVFDCPGCIVYDESGQEVTTIDIKVPDTTYTTYHKFFLKGDHLHHSPLDSSISIKKGEQTIENYDYIGSTGEITLPILGDMKITAQGFNKNLQECEWSEISEISTTGRAKEFFSIGEEKVITVNKQLHRIRIIGFNHDKLSSDTSKMAGITFEFVNLLSDEEGYSLATPWDSEDGVGSTNNYNFLNSNLRKAFDGNAETSIVWARKGEFTETTEEPYYHKTVLDMLPVDLKKVLKEVRKEVTIYNTDKNEYEVNKTDYNTTIFPLSYAETNETSSEEVLTEGSIYEFYKPDGSNKEAKRIKYQVKWHNGAIKYDQQPFIDDRGANSAGYNDPTDEYGGFYWMRSPKVKGYNFSTSVYQGYYDGDLLTILCHSSLLAIAPAFCV